MSICRNELIIKDMLMHESLKQSGAKAEFVFFDENGNQNSGMCETRLYETAIVVIPEKGEIVRIPYCDISEIKEEDYTLSLVTEYEESIVLSKMGKKFDYFTKTIAAILNDLSLKVQASLKELTPKLDPITIRRVSGYMKEGKAAKRSDLESVSPQLWSEIENKIKELGIGEEYKFLESLSQKEKICIGLKRGLMGDLTGEYIWFLIPIYSVNSNEPGNIVAMEAISEEGGSASYFFRMVKRKDYSGFNNIDDLHREADKFITKINRSMLAINFRRAPIYLPDERLEEPRYQKYKIAISKIPQLKELRELFIGRIIHGNIDRWKDDVMELCRFNVSTTDDFARWARGEDIVEDESLEHE